MDFQVCQAQKSRVLCHLKSSFSSLGVWLCSEKKIDLSLSSKSRPPHQGALPGHILTNLITNTLLDANANRKLGKTTDSEQLKISKTDYLLTD